MEQPKVSIITVYYNRAHCVEESIRSLIDQTYRDFELLLVDDGSTDETLKRFNKFTDPRIKIISHANMGFTSSIKQAVAQAKGEYIAIHGSGDISFPERIKKLFNFLEHNPDYVIAAPRFERYDEVTLVKIEDSAFSGDLIFEDFLQNCRLMHGAIMFRKSVYDQVGGYETAFKTSQDWDLFLRFLKVGKGKVLKDILYRQYKRRDAIAANPKNFEKVCSYYALLVMLAKRSENRKEILDKVYGGGIEAVISKENPDFQRMFVNDATLLVKRGRHLDFMEYAEQVELKTMSFKLKLKFISWLGIAKLMKLAGIDGKKAIVVFSKMKSVKGYMAGKK